MQFPTESTSPSWFNVALTLAGTVTGAAIVKLYNIWVAYRKLPTEIHKTAAEARQIDAHADSEISESMARVTLRLEQMQIRVDQIVAERDQARNENARQEIEIGLMAYQIKRQKALLDYHNISYSEFDGPAK